MPIQVTPLAESDIDEAITTIQLAFADDPYNLWVYDDRSKSLGRPFSRHLLQRFIASHVSSYNPIVTKPNVQKVDLARNRVSLGIRCRWGIRNALFHVAKDVGSDKVLGIAMWMPPRPVDQRLTWAQWLWEQWEDWSLWGSQVRMNLWYGRGGLNVKRYYIWKASQAQAQKEIWTDPRGYYFLNIITVLPSEQGKGIGKALFQEVTKMADAQGIRCYLESSRDQPNTKIYEAMGFNFVRGLDCDDDGVVCKLYCMVREHKPLRTE